MKLGAFKPIAINECGKSGFGLMHAEMGSKESTSRGDSERTRKSSFVRFAINRALESTVLISETLDVSGVARQDSENAVRIARGKSAS